MDSLLIKVIDENWLTTLVTIVTSSYIFLLGVPMLIAQTFLPEEIREMYSKRETTRKDVLKIKQLGVLALVYALMACVFNVLFPVLFIQNEAYTGHGKYVFIISYISFVVFLCIYSILLYAFLSKQLSNSNPRKNVIDAIIGEAKIYFSKNERVNPDDVADLQTIGKALSAGLKKSELLKGMASLVNHVLDSEHYKGGELDTLLKDVLAESFCHSNDSSSEANLNEALKICRKIRHKYNNENDYSLADINVLVGVIYKIANIALEKNYDNIFKISTDMLRLVRSERKLPENSFYLNKISHRCFKNGNYKFVTHEIRELHTIITKDKDDRNHLYTMLHYISWFYVDNEHMKEFSRIKVHEIKNTFTDSYITEAIRYFNDAHDYEAASRINVIKKKYFDLQNENGSS